MHTKQKGRRPQSLLEWRKAHGYTQAQAAALLGISAPGYHTFEHGQRHPRPAALKRIVKITGVPVEVLAGIA